MRRRELSRRAAITAPALAFLAAASPTLSDAVTDYRLLMARKDEVNSSEAWSDVERWCDDEAAALSRLADARGDLRDLLAKVLIVADRADDAQWNMQDGEYDLFASMREQALELLRAGGGQA
jgi:hypothetical protein